MSVSRKNLRSRWIAPILAALCLAGGVVRADTVTELDFDVNTIAIQAKNGQGQNIFTGVHHTGELILSSGVLSTMGVGIDGVYEPSLTASQMSLFGDVFLVNGVLDHGTVTLGASNSSDTYAFDVQAGSGSLHKIGTKNSYLLSGMTINGLLNHDTFGGVDVQLWHDQQPLMGSFVQFFFRPNSSGYDGATSLDVAAYATIAPPTVIPLPQAVWGGASLLAVLAGVKFLKRNDSRGSSL
jgi:hypothetical protein